MTRNPNTPPSTPHPVAPAGDEPMQRRRTVKQANAAGLIVYPGRAPHVRTGGIRLDGSESLESVRETYWADEAEKLRAENARLRDERSGYRDLIRNELGAERLRTFDTCPSCAGRGATLVRHGIRDYVSDHPCDTCRGTGRRFPALAPQPGSESRKKGDV